MYTYIYFVLYIHIYICIKQTNKQTATALIIPTVLVTNPYRVTHSKHSKCQLPAQTNHFAVRDFLIKLIQHM